MALPFMAAIFSEANSPHSDKSNKASIANFKALSHHKKTLLAAHFRR
jgi:hypothetical protein